MNGAPRIAPTPISSECAPPANRIAMIGIIVSGRAVPTAARTDPTAPSARPSLRPNHSMPLVNSSAPARMMTNDPRRMRRSIVPSLSPSRQERRARRRRGSGRPPAPSLAPLAARTRSGRRRPAARASPRSRGCPATGTAAGRPAAFGGLGFLRPGRRLLGPSSCSGAWRPGWQSADGARRLCLGALVETLAAWRPRTRSSNGRRRRLRIGGEHAGRRHPPRAGLD